MARLLLALALFAAGTDAFLLPFAPRTATAPLRAAVSMGLEEAADKCIEEGCPIDLVDELIAELKESGNTKLAKQLQDSLAAGADKSELEKMIAGMGRNFGKVDAFSFPGPATGYTGETGTTTTAGKSLK